jgi:hypothetical protein
MPLRFDYINDKYSQSGSIVIDRCNFVINFGLSQDSIANQKKTVQAKLRFDRVLARKIIAAVGSEMEPHIDINGPSHDVIDHVCERDKSYSHIHIKFKRNIDICLMDMLVNAASESEWFEVMSPSSFKEMKEVIGFYFLESANDHALEKQYNAEKMRALEHNSDLNDNEIFISYMRRDHFSPSDLYSFFKKEDSTSYTAGCSLSL